MKNSLLLDRIRYKFQKAYLTVSLLFLSVQIFSQQNLVPDPSFENYVQCPQMPNVFNNFLTDWRDPTNCTSDYYHTCSSVFTVPETPMGFQQPKSGDGFVGIACEVYSPPNITNYGREYVQSKLIDTLKSGKQYCVSFFVNVPDGIKYTTSRIGMYLGDAIPSIISCPPQPIYIPQIENPLGNFITDSINWTKISGVYTAAGTEQYITIGNFYVPSNTDTLRFNPSSGVGGVYVYFYIDEVSVNEILSAKAGNDTLINNPATVQLGLNTDTSAFYEWWPHTGIADTNTMNPIANVTQTTTYYVSKTQCGVVSTDSILVIVSPIGLKEIDYKEEFVLSPNPNNGSFALQSKSGKAFSGFAQLYDICGKLVYEERIENQSGFIIHSKEISSGVYFVKLADKNRKVVFVCKTIVQ